MRDAVEDGADLVTGGERWRHAYLEQGAYFQPTVLANVQQGMEIAQQERASLLCAVLLVTSRLPGQCSPPSRW